MHEYETLRDMTSNKKVAHVSRMIISYLIMIKQGWTARCRYSLVSIIADYYPSERSFQINDKHVSYHICLPLMDYVTLSPRHHVTKDTASTPV